MKNILFVILIAAFINTNGQIKSASLTASGLTCSMCSKSIFKALEKVPSIESVDVDIDESIFKIKFKNDANVQADDIKKAVVDAGFAVASLKMTADFPATTIAKVTHLNFANGTYHFINVPAQTISGEQTFTVIDKNFVSPAEYKKFKKIANMKCYETGKAEACCEKDIATGTRIYHITL